MANNPSVRRMHYKANGQPKQPLNRTKAAEARKNGWHTYLCPLCGKTHASKKYT